MFSQLPYIVAFVICVFAVFMGALAYGQFTTRKR